MGAGLAFDAAHERYTRQDFIWLNYHVHIPQPDPMVNPSTVARRTFYGVNSSPSYFFDGESDGGGGSADGAKALFESKVDPKIQTHLAVAPEAAVTVQATPGRQHGEGDGQRVGRQEQVGPNCVFRSCSPRSR